MKTRAKILLVVYLCERDDERLLQISIEGEMEFPGLPPQKGGGFLKDPTDHKKKMLEVDEIEWKPDKGVWQSVLNFKPFVVGLEKSKRFNLAVYQSLLEQIFLPGFEIRNVYGDKDPHPSLLEFPIPTEAEKHFERSV